MSQNKAVILVVGIIIVLSVASLAIFLKPQSQKKSADNISKQNKTIAPTVKMSANDVTLYNAKGKPDVVVAASSSIPGYDAKVVGNENLYLYLNTWRVVDTGINTSYGTSNTDIKNVNIELVSQPQPLFPVQNLDKEQLASVNVVIKDGEIDVPVYISTKGLEDPNKYFESEALLALYSISHQATSKSKDTFLGTFNYFWNQKEAKHQKFFEVVKK